MSTEKVKEIIVLKNSLKVLRLCYLFPSKEEIENPEMNIYIKYILLNLAIVYLPVGTILHLTVAVLSEYFYHILTKIIRFVFV